jgi:DNA-directed RNA polymerase specialized sigma subunit
LERPWDLRRGLASLKAISNFDPSFGRSLAAYAQPCTSGEIKRHFRDKAGRFT